MYYEIKTGDSYNKPEDHTVIVRANDMMEALKLFKDNRGDSTLKGQPIACREIFYVKDWSPKV
jgi:hypothetical protein